MYVHLKSRFTLFSCSTSVLAVALAAMASTGAAAQVADEGPRASQQTVPEDQAAAAGEIIVTAQKRSQSINKVGMSISAATGDELIQRGITDTSQLTKIVPGFNYTLTSYATPVYTIRGVGFQETSLAASPAVSVYVDEVPLPYAAETVGATLDLERVEVLKGPQGTLYGQNSTGGAVNYISAKPTSTFEAGATGTYGRFNDVDISGYVSGPISDTLLARISIRYERSDDWQKSYTRHDTLGATKMLQGRLLLDWKPVDRLKVSINLNGWRDRSDSPAGQDVAFHPEIPAPLAPGLVAYPLSPDKPRAADWTPGRDYRRNNQFYLAAIRIDYEIADDVTLTSLSSYQHYKRGQRVDADGTSFEDFEINQSGHIDTFFQELRVGGDLANGKGNWIVGANYETDKTNDVNLLLFHDSSVRSALNFGDVRNSTLQNVKTYAGYGNFEYELLSGLRLQAGARYTQANRNLVACSADTGNGQLAAFFSVLQSMLRGGAPIMQLAPGSCSTFDSNLNLGPVYNKLNQHNLSWRVGLNWAAAPGILLYGNVSEGYKSGSFPTLSANRDIVFRPVTQESVVAYEAGVKATLLNGTLHIDGAGFYYDYSQKQIRGKVISQPFGLLDALVNVPKSFIDGFELSATWRPFEGLTLSPAVTLVHSKIKGQFINYNPFDLDAQNFGGESFPYTPKWQSNIDAEYRRPLNASLDGFVGGNVSYQGPTNGAFGELPDFRIPGYTLLDLRAGLRASNGNWNVSIFGRNVTNKFYTISRSYIVDTVYRFVGRPATYGVTLGYRFR